MEIDLKQKNLIKKYIETFLPKHYEDIEPLNDKCKVIVSIPAYAERQFILKPLLSLARQVGVDKDNFEIQIVVNGKPNPPEHPAGESEEIYHKRLELFYKSLQDNQQTIKLIDSIRNKTEVDIQEDEKIILKEIFDSNLKVKAIDLASEENTLPMRYANGGGARNAGVAVAVKRFFESNNNGIIAQTDADTYVSSHWIKRIIEAFENDNDLVGLRGQVIYDRSNESIETPRKWDLYEIEGGYRSLLRKLAAKKTNYQGMTTKNVIGAGANMATRAYESAIAGGVPRIPGSQDVFFGYRMAKVGKLKLDESIKVFTSTRLSSRATRGTGKMLNKQEQGNTILVPDLQSMCIRLNLLAQFSEHCNENKDCEFLNTLLKLNSKELFTKKEIENIKNQLAEIYDCTCLEKGELLRRFLEDIEDRYSNLIPLEKALTSHLHDIFKNELKLDGEVEKSLEKIKASESEKMQINTHTFNTLCKTIKDTNLQIQTFDEFRIFIYKNIAELKLDESSVEMLLFSRIPSWVINTFKHKKTCNEEDLLDLYKAANNNNIYEWLQQVRSYEQTYNHK